jgi:hypothetical protein
MMAGVIVQSAVKSARRKAPGSLRKREAEWVSRLCIAEGQTRETYDGLSSWAVDGWSLAKNQSPTAFDYELLTDDEEPTSKDELPVRMRPP